MSFFIKIVYFIGLFFFLNIKTNDIYLCTATDDLYFNNLLNLIGSLHKTNFNNLSELAVFDLGLTNEQIVKLQTIKKTKVYKVELTHPDLLKPFKVNNYKFVKGWYAWKHVIIKQALDLFPYVLYIDSGTTILKPLDDLFKYIKEDGYFLITVGDEIKKNFFQRDVKWQTTKYLLEKFGINTKEKEWILNQESISGSPIGVSRQAMNEFITTLYECTYDLRNYGDDGTTPDGFGTARHDQALLTLVAYIKGLRIHRQDFSQKSPIYFNVNNIEIPFYITWHSSFVDSNTHIYCSRNDLRNFNDFISYIEYK